MYLQPNTLLQGGKYKIVRHISSSGFGNTYEGELTLLHYRVAIKEFFIKDFCNRDAQTSHVTVGTQSKAALVEKLRKKFLEEAATLFSIHHEHIIRVTDIFEENGTAYYVMDFIEGESLQQMLKRRGTLSEETALVYIHQVADALDYIHSQNRLHLDVKPDNIMVTRQDNAILIDFGASKHYDDESGENTSTLMGVNTKGYAPIEQTTQSFTSFSPATDIYALGATLYKLLTGVTPPDANLLMAEEQTLQPLPSSISASTREAVKRSMSLKRKDRPQSIPELLAILDSKSATQVSTHEEVEVTLLDEPHPKPLSNTINDPSTQAHPQPKVESVSTDAVKGSRRKQGLVFFIIALLVIGIFVAIGLSLNNSSEMEYSSDTASNDTVSLAAAIEDLSDQTFTVNGVSFTMVAVEGGTFKMGATAEQGEDAFDPEKPAHSVTLSSYFIGQTEVTQALWKAVMGSNPSNWKGDNLPVANVCWFDCQDFIRKLNQLTGKKFRLPTEAEWEYAARGGRKSRGYKYAGSNAIDEVAWYYNNSGDRTHTVATKKANELGLYDMSGNVCEWCQDWFGDYSSSSQTNPTCNSGSSLRVFRGGSGNGTAEVNALAEGDAECCRTSYRGAGFEVDSYDHNGFRLAL